MKLNLRVISVLIILITISLEIDAKAEPIKDKDKDYEDWKIAKARMEEIESYYGKSGFEEFMDRGSEFFKIKRKPMTWFDYLEFTFRAVVVYQDLQDEYYRYKYNRSIKDGQDL